MPPSPASQLAADSAAAYVGGASIAKVATTFGVSPYTVTTAWRQHHVQMRPNNPPPPQATTEMVEAWGERRRSIRQPGGVRSRPPVSSSASAAASGEPLHSIRS